MAMDTLFDFCDHWEKQTFFDKLYSLIFHIIVVCMRVAANFY